MPTAEEFIQTATQAGYSRREIEAFLRRSNKMTPKQRQALELLRRMPETPDTLQEELISQTVPQEEESLIPPTARRIGTAALAAGGAALLGGPIAGAIGGMAQGISPDEGEIPAEAPPPSPDGGGSFGGIGLHMPNLREFVTLYNTYRRRGGLQTLAQFISTQARAVARNVEQRVDAPEEVGRLPPDIEQAATDALQQTGAPDSAFNVVLPQVAQGGRLFASAQRFQRQTGRRIEEALQEFFTAGAATGPAQAPPSPAQTAQPRGPGDLSQLSDSELQNIMRRRGLL
jgi:hypothetical protein